MAVSAHPLGVLADEWLKTPDWLESSEDPRERFRIGPWELTCEVAAGRWTTLYRARSIDSSADGLGAYAVKLVASDVVDPEWAASLLAREWLASSAVASPHVLSVLGGELHRSPCHLLFPWLSGCNLERRLAEPTRPTAVEAVWIARQIAQGLGSLHDLEWIHGDVTPRNIHVGHDGHATLIDLGMARRVDELRPTSHGCETFDAFLGTIRYAAPELFDERPWLTPAIDVFSLGCVLFECFVGRPPHCEPCDPPETDAQVIAKRRLGPHEKLSTDMAPPALAKLVDRMLARDPLRRPTAGELVDALTRIEIELLANRAPPRGATSTRPTRVRERSIECQAYG